MYTNAKDNPMKIVKIIPDEVDIDYHGKTSKPGCRLEILMVAAFWAEELKLIIS